jgi:serine/threonine protein kinase
MISANAAMTPEKWQQIKQVFDEALNQPITKRGAVVRQLCNGDEELESEVQRLLGANETAAASFLETPVVDLRGYLAAQGNVSSLAPDSIIAERFEILRFLNRGGMGEVYEAWDSELKERVALKTIRPGFAFDSAVIARFKREVKQARGISHPNVCRVYELFSHDASPQKRIWFLSMELLEGPTLLERIRYQGPMDRKVALKLVEQMVSGLAAAHALGVVHRDFKSSNVMLVPSTGGHDRAVITDFGLALNLFRPSEEPPEPAGQGTPDYMAPEQRETGEVSFLADQYALGVVMCEMLTCSLPIRSKEPAPDDKLSMPTVKLPDHPLDSRWEVVISRCLQIRPEDRFQNVSDVITALVPPKKLWSLWQVRAIAALILVLVAATLLTRRPVSRVSSLTQLTPATDLSDSPSLSKDGKLVAYMSDRAESGNVDIFVQQLPDGVTTQITRDPAEENNPSISPDGSLVVYRSERNGGGTYISSSAGTGEHLLAPGGRNPHFSPDGQRVVYWVGDKDLGVASGQLYIVSPSGGTPVRIASDFIDARLPVWSSDGKLILFAGCRTSGQPLPACSDWWATTPDGRSIWNTGALAKLAKAGITPVDVIGEWHGDDLIFTGDKGPVTNLWDLRLPLAKVRAASAPEQLTTGENTEMNPTLADNNRIAFSRVAGALHIRRIDDALHPSAASASNLTGNAATDRCPYISHNGKWLVFARGYGKRTAIWVKDIQSGVESPFLSNDQLKFSPIIDESGETIAFEATENSVLSIYIAKRGKQPWRLCSACGRPTGWIEGDRAIFYSEGSPSRIELADIATKTARVAVQQPGSSLAEASWSPENQYLLFTKEQPGGLRQVFTVAFPSQSGHAIGKWVPITAASEWSGKPRWSGDGKNIFYLSTRDGFSCIWGQHFDPKSGKLKGRPFPVMHYHNFRNSIGNVFPGSFNLSVAGNSVYLNVGESNSSIWTGVLKPPSKLSRFK